MRIIEGLNNKQQLAVLSKAKRLLVLAGAGSGKTKTVISKLMHLVEVESIKPASILAITFTKNAANEMVDRLIIASDKTNSYELLTKDKRITALEKDKERTNRILNEPWIANLTIKTFHSLCYKILRDKGHPVFDSKFRLITDDPSEASDAGGGVITSVEKPKDIIHKLLIVLSKDRNYLLKLKRYILDYYVDKVSLEKEMKNYANVGQKTYTTLKGETVKSKSERDIADWLYRHNIRYEYEKKMNFKDFNFKPDFFIPEADLFLEHISNKSYSMEDKEKQFVEGGRNCVITYEPMMNNSNLFNLAMERIVMGKISLAITESISGNFEEEFKTYHDKIQEFLKTVLRLQSMVKGSGIEPSSLLGKAGQNEHERVRVFYELAIPLLEAYKGYCTNRSFLDFDDLLLLTIKLLRENTDVREFYRDKFKFIMVDEFQDVNGLQVSLLDLLAKPESQLFCVGDDWQSIYGFRGSDVDYIVNFQKHYKDAEIHKLDINYRSNQTIVGASNEVIKNNKNQISKEIKAFKQSPSKIQIYRAKKLADDGVEFLVKEVRELYEKGLGKEDILVLYRRTKMFSPYFEALKANHLFVSYKTIHASKGLEAKAVFILGLTEGNGGFPDIWLDDPIFRVVKDVKYDILLEEERRLFYVAITRAKDELFLVTEIGNESSFLEEIPIEYFQANALGFKNSCEDITCIFCNKVVGEGDNFCRNCGWDQSQTLPDFSDESTAFDHIEKARLTHKNAYMPWTPADDLKLTELFVGGASTKELMNLFGRNQGAIQSRIKKLALE